MLTVLGLAANPLFPQNFFSNVKAISRDQNSGVAVSDNSFGEAERLLMKEYFFFFFFFFFFF